MGEERGDVVKIDPSEKNPMLFCQEYAALAAKLIEDSHVMVVRDADAKQYKVAVQADIIYMDDKTIKQLSEYWRDALSLAIYKKGDEAVLEIAVADIE